MCLPKNPLAPVRKILGILQNLDIKLEKGLSNRPVCANSSTNEESRNTSFQ